VSIHGTRVLSLTFAVSEKHFAKTTFTAFLHVQQIFTIMNVVAVVAAVSTSQVDGPYRRPVLMGNGNRSPSTWAVNLGSGNWALGSHEVRRWSIHRFKICGRAMQICIKLRKKILF